MISLNVSGFRINSSRSLAVKNFFPPIKTGSLPIYLEKKLPNRYPEITKVMAKVAVSRDAFPFYYEKLLHETFRASIHAAQHFPTRMHAWGWNSDVGSYYFGYTLYILSYQNTYLFSRCHDNVNGIVTLKEFRIWTPPWLYKTCSLIPRMTTILPIIFAKNQGRCTWHTCLQSWIPDGILGLLQRTRSEQMALPAGL